MTLTVRIDVDYVPWGHRVRPSAGHAAPAVFLRVMALARREGWKLHVFLSRRSLQALPSFLEATLGEGHDLDAYAPEARQGAAEAKAIQADFLRNLHPVLGLAIPGAWDAGELPPEFEFVAARGGVPAEPVRAFDPEDRVHCQAVASLTALAHEDAHLERFAAQIQERLKEGRRIRTLRELMREPTA